VVGWSPAALSYYERGARDGLFDIRTALQFADAVGMPRAALLPLVLADPDAGPAAGNGTGMRPDLRGPSGLAGVAGAAVVLSPSGVPRAVSASQVRYWRACTDVLCAQGHAVGGTVLLAAALQQWQRVRLTLTESAAGETGRLSHAVAGEAAVCTGWIALDARCLPLARRLYERAAGLVSGGVPGDDVGAAGRR
jgi:hypothetical protein